MERVFIPIYRFFRDRRWLLYTLLVVSVALFGYYASKITYEENILKLLPSTEKSEDGSLAFGNIRVKDKIFVQLRSTGVDLSPEELGAHCEEFSERLLERTKQTGDIDNILYRIDDDLAVMGLDYALGNVASLVDEECYEGFDSLTYRTAIAERMAKNKQTILNDEEGSLTTMVCQDPAALREAVLPHLMQGVDGAGFTVVDNHLFSRDTTVAMAFVAPNFESTDSKTGTRLIGMLESEIEAFEAEHPEVEVLFHGAPVQSVYNSRQIKKDLFTTLGISLAIICIVLWLCFRKLRSILLLLVPICYGVLMALASVFWIKGEMSLMVVGLGTLVLGVALSYSLHIVTHHNFVTDPERLLRDQSTPVTLGCLTTIGAFVGLMFTKSELLQDFGLFASLAMVGTTLFSLIFLPHMLDSRVSTKSQRAFATINRIGSYPLDRKLWLNLAIVVICVVCAAVSGLITFDSNLRNIGYNEPKIVESQRLYAEKNNNGCSSMYYAATADTLDEAIACSDKVATTLSDLKERGVVASYTNLSSILVPEKEQLRRIAKWEEYWSTERIASLRQDVTDAALANDLDPVVFEPFYTMLETKYEPSSLYEAGIIPDNLISNYVERCGDNYLVFSSAKMTEPNKAEVNDEIAKIDGALVVDPFYYSSDMVSMLNDDFNTILGISSIFVFVVLLVSFRSIVKALIAFMPMAVSWYVVKGAMVLLGIEFNLINIIITAFIFGIGVDYSIFVMNGLIDSMRNASSPLLAWHKSAIVLSAFVLIVVVCSLMTATHPAIASIGLSTLIGMGSTILLTYTLQPALFRLCVKWGLIKK